MTTKYSTEVVIIVAFLAGTVLFSGRVPSAQNSAYSQWTYGPSTRPNFFPIGVWLQDPSTIQEFKKIGINMFIGFYGSLDQTSLSAFASGHMPVVPTQNSVGLKSPQRPWIWGWNQIDEPDNAQPNGHGGYGPCISPSTLVADYNAIKATDALSPVFLNFGRGATLTSYPGRGTCTGNTAYYPKAIAAGDIILFDIYPVADYSGKLELVSQGVNNLKTWAAQCNCGDKPIWNFIETTPFGGRATPTPAQIQAEVWMSLIHGSRGIVYFVDLFSPNFVADGIFRYPTSVQAVTSVDAQITSLAPVLNSTTVTGDVQVSSSASGVAVDIMEKNYGGSKYVFAVAMANSFTTGTFTVPGNPTTTVAVLGESRRIAMTGGKFQDRFAGYGVHLYQFRSGTSSSGGASGQP